METDEKYIVTVSVDSWGVGDSNVSTPLPSSVESYVDADGTPHGLWWRIDWEAPYIVSPYPLEASRDGRSVTMEFNRSIVRDNTMGAISYEVLVEEAGEARTIYQGNFPEENIAAEGRMLTVTLPESIVFERGVTYTVLLSFEEGAVEDLYGIKMEAIVNEMQEDGQPIGPWWCVNRPGLGEFSRKVSTLSVWCLKEHLILNRCLQRLTSRMLAILTLPDGDKLTPVLQQKSGISVISSKALSWV